MRIPLRFALLVSALVSVAFAEATSTPPAAPLTVPPLSGKLGAPIQLFNGKDFSGWVWFQKPPRSGPPAPAAALNEVFSVKDGILHVAGKPNGYLYTEKEFTNFVLTTEQRHITKGNGGLLVGFVATTGQSWPGLEIQTMTGSAGDLWNHNKLKLGTDPARTQNTRVVRAGPDSQKAIGEWETMEVTVDRGNLIFKVNGIVQNVATETESLAGKIGLQVEGAEMEYRKVQITPIEPAGK